MSQQQKPKLLVLDIETKPGIAYIWRMWDENVPAERLIESDGILCIGVKWVGDKKGQILSEWEHGMEGMLTRLSELIVEADAIITYNGKRFDLPHINTQIIRAGLPALPPVSHIDLFQFIRTTKFMSKKLGFVGPELGIGEKLKHSGFDLWEGVMKGDKKAQAEMSKYCGQDVDLTEELYQRVKGYIPNHPSLVFMGKETCPTCGSGRTQRRGHYHTRMYQWQRHQCTDCGSWFKTTQQKKKRLEAE